MKLAHPLTYEACSYHVNVSVDGLARAPRQTHESVGIRGGPIATDALSTSRLFLISQLESGAGQLLPIAADRSLLRTGSERDKGAGTPHHHNHHHHHHHPHTHVVGQNEDVWFHASRGGGKMNVRKKNPQKWVVRQTTYTVGPCVGKTRNPERAAAAGAAARHCGPAASRAAACTFASFAVFCSVSA